MVIIKLCSISLEEGLSCCYYTGGNGCVSKTFYQFLCSYKPIHLINDLKNIPHSWKTSILLNVPFPFGFDAIDQTQRDTKWPEIIKYTELPIDNLSSCRSIEISNHDHTFVTWLQRYVACW
jgi:hypothetical protein